MQGLTTKIHKLKQAVNKKEKPMPETYANIPLFVAQVAILLPVMLISLIASFAWATYQDKKLEQGD